MTGRKLLRPNCPIFKGRYTALDAPPNRLHGMHQEALTATCKFSDENTPIFWRISFLPNYYGKVLILWEFHTLMHPSACPIGSCAGGYYVVALEISIGWAVF